MGVWFLHYKGEQTVLAGLPQSVNVPDEVEERGAMDVFQFVTREALVRGLISDEDYDDFLDESGESILNRLYLARPIDEWDEIEDDIEDWMV